MGLWEGRLSGGGEGSWTRQVCMYPRNLAGQDISSIRILAAGSASDATLGARRGDDGHDWPVLPTR
jgi:hypothetical protein